MDQVVGSLDAAQVAVLDLQTGTRTVLVRGGSHAHYVQAGDGEKGYLVYAAAGTLRAVAFDLARLETRGTPVPVVPDVVTTGAGGVDAVVAGDGTLLLVPTPGHTPGHLSLLVDAGERRFLLAGDLVHNAAELASVAPAVAGWCAENGVVVLAAHDPAARERLI